jgi:hypothetical protein
MSAHTTCSAAIFASVAATPDAMKGSVSASGPMSFVVRNPSRGLRLLRAKHWNQDAEAIINEVGRREYDKRR